MQYAIQEFHIPVLEMYLQGGSKKWGVQKKIWTIFKKLWTI
jgi:hypothetical protein